MSAVLKSKHFIAQVIILLISLAANANNPTNIAGFPTYTIVQTNPSVKTPDFPVRHLLSITLTNAKLDVNGSFRDKYLNNDGRTRLPADLSFQQFERLNNLAKYKCQQYLNMAKQGIPGAQLECRLTSVDLQGNYCIPGIAYCQAPHKIRKVILEK